MPKYKIGKYTSTGKPLKKYIRKSKYNSKYNGKSTIRKQKEQRRLALMLIGGFILIGITQYITLTTNTIHIKGGEVVSKVRAGEQAPTQSIGDVQSLVATSPSDEVEQQIRNIAREHNFQWTDYLIRLARCENRALDPKVINDKGNYPIYSKDRGIFQINDYWHKEVSDECAHSIRCSTIWTMERINAGYQHEWVCNNLI